MNELTSIIKASKRIVFFGGAGVSTDTVQLHRTKGMVLLDEYQGKTEVDEGS